MKIIQLVFTLSSGGAEKFVVNLSNELAQLGHNVTIMQLRCDEKGEGIHFNKQFISSNVRYVNLGLTKGFTFGKALKVMKAIKKEKADVVHSHLNLLPYYYPMTLFGSHTKFVHTLHNIAQKETSIPWQQKLNRIVYKLGLIKSVTISDECEESFEKLYGIKPYAKIDNGCPAISTTSRIHEVKDEIDSLKKTPKSKIFIHIARFGAAKNQGMLIEAFNKMVNNGLNADLLIIGNGFDSEEGRKLLDKSCDCIHFLGTRTNIGDYLAWSDYFILSSTWEGLPISLIEAMSARVTPVCTPAGGIKNVIQDTVNGFLSRDFSEGEFIRTIQRALSKPLDSDMIYESYKQYYSMEECANKYVKVYKS